MDPTDRSSKPAAQSAFGAVPQSAPQPASQVAARLASLLATSRFGRHLHPFESLPSTNDEARRLAAACAPEGTVVLASNQESGRGRQNRQWHSEPGRNLTFTLILRPPLPAHLLGILPLHAAVAVAETARRLGAPAAGCKWPNDVVSGGRKLAGILCESSITGASAAHVLVGIGLNVNQRDFPGALAGNATSLSLLSGGEFDLAAPLAGLLSRLEESYRPGDPDWPGAVAAEWTRLSVMLGARVQASTGSGGTDAIVRGIARSVSPAGALRVETERGVVELTAGDVHLQ